jgi:hypothetical protein
MFRGNHQRGEKTNLKQRSDHVGPDEAPMKQKKIRSRPDKKRRPLMSRREINADDIQILPIEEFTREESTKGSY